MRSEGPEAEVGTDEAESVGQEPGLGEDSLEAEAQAETSAEAAVAVAAAAAAAATAGEPELLEPGRVGGGASGEGRGNGEAAGAATPALATSPAPALPADAAAVGAAAAAPAAASPAPPPANSTAATAAGATAAAPTASPASPPTEVVAAVGAKTVPVIELSPAKPMDRGGSGRRVARGPPGSTSVSPQRPRKGPQEFDLTEEDDDAAEQDFFPEWSTGDVLRGWVQHFDIALGDEEKADDETSTEAFSSVLSPRTPRLGAYNFDLQTRPTNGGPQGRRT